MAPVTVPGLAILVVAYFLFKFLIHATQDIKEPPILHVGIPLLGPVLRMLKEKDSFYPRLRDRYNLPFYTLRLPFTRIYVLNATELIAPIQKRWRDISFAGIIAGTTRACGLSKEAKALIFADLKTDESLTISTTVRMAQAAAPGEGLDAMLRRAIEVFTAGLERLVDKSPDGTTVGLHEWVRESMHAATLEAVYGPESPYREPRVADAYSIFEPGFIAVMLSPFPQLSARSVLRAREVLAVAMAEFIRRGSWKKASGLVRASIGRLLELGMSVQDVARCEISGTIAVLSSSAPCAWWTVFQIFSDPRVLADVRREAEALVTVEDGTSRVDLARVRVDCPVLLSTFTETMRHRGVGVSARLLLEDVEVAGYTLKKGNLLMIPSKVQHTSEAAWGEHVAKFDHLRFVPGRVRPNRTALRVWGGGHVLCPGRHFASAEILAFAALVVLRFDIRPLAGRWLEPSWARSPLAAGFPVPDEDTLVEIVPRRQGRRWAVSFSDFGAGVNSPDGE